MNKEDLNLDIEILGLDTRIHRALVSDRISTIGDLLSYADKHLIIIPKIGKKSILKIKESLRLFNEGRPKYSTPANETSLSQTKESLSNVTQLIQITIKESLINFNTQINELRTVILEQQRVIESIQIEKSPDGILKRIDEKLPGFASTVYDLYKKVQNT